MGSVSPLRSALELACRFSSQGQNELGESSEIATEVVTSTWVEDQL